MIKKLRYKFIAVTMSLICLVLLVVFVIIAVTNYQQLRAETFTAMKHALSMNDNIDALRPEIGYFRNKPPKPDARSDSPDRIVPVVSVVVDNEGHILRTFENNARISQDVLTEGIATVLSTDSEHEKLSNLNLRYMKQNLNNGDIQIVFADLNMEFTAMRSLIFALIGSFAGAMIVFLIICTLLSFWITKPVAEAWDKQKQFIADASHELKTPLTVILANLNIIKNHSEATVISQSKWIESTQDEAVRMKKLVEDLLFLAKTDATDVPMVKADVDVSECVWSVLLPFETIAFERGINIEEKITDNLHAEGDVNQIKQLITILVDNGCKYASPNSSIKVSLKPENSHIQFSVHNHGHYIAPENLAHIFDRFYRANASRSSYSGSYGLGLAIAKSIVDHHHGEILVSSDPDEGTCFTVTL